ncbi:bifunctional riboflavin kinase/FAD synthetase [Dokdonella sp.]|uniref:bifunctional riboflavin kinase/FAD synthetase n=1 Tax=Dokdonella sp. TaxID=2291710 RepID=UPI0039C8B1FC
MFRLFRDSLGACLAPRGSVVCIGAFDGVHCGHRALLQRVRERADALGVEAVAISFEPIPREFFARSTPVPRLDDVRGKIRQIRATKMDLLLLLRFNAELAAMPAEAFVEQILLNRLEVQEVWVGEDFRFGHARSGNVDLLRTMGAVHGFRAEVFSEFTLGSQRVRSSAIRELLAEGDFVSARHLLGRPFKIGGHVVYGQQLGRKLGYPTANIRLGCRTSPISGIFAVRVHGVAEHSLPAVASLGIRPTVNGVEPLLEAHLFDFDGDLYGRRIDVEFVAKLRDEEKFSTLEAMVEQIDLDAAEARALLATPQSDFPPDAANKDGRVRSSGVFA